MLTHEGRLVLQSNTESPTIGDVAYHLGKIIRFGGACEGWWTVLQHSLVCHDLALNYAEQNEYKLEAKTLLALHMLLHDAHESITSDIPSTWKSSEMKTYQKDLDKRIYQSLCLSPPSEHDLKVIAEIDEKALIAEAFTIFRSFFNYDSRDVSLEAKMTAYHIAKLYSRPSTTVGEDAPAVKKYQLLVNSYLSMINENDPYRTPIKIGLGVPTLTDELAPESFTGVLGLL